MDTSMVLLVALLVLFSIANTKFSFGDGGSYSVMVCTQRERKALLSFKQGLKDPSNRLSSWAGEDCCTWMGVGCDNTTGRVVRLHLRGSEDGYYHDYKDFEAYKRSKLRGVISPSLLELKYLNYLDLSLNDFGGIRIPSFLGSLKNLRYLNLSGAGFGGTIPHQLGNLSSLRYLDLIHNNPYIYHFSYPFTYHEGPYPDWYDLGVDNLQWLSRLSSLQYLDLSQVNLEKASDHWLQVINMLPSLLQLHLNQCNLQGFLHSLPYVNFTSLSILDLSGNSFGDHSMPNWLFSLTDLVSLKFSSNPFQDPIPGALQNLTKLRALDLSYNNFNSTIPNWLYNLSNLESLDLSGNDLQGSISLAIGNLTSITDLDLSYSNLEGEIPTTLGDLCNLKILRLPENKLRGEISRFLTSSSGCIAGSLEILDLTDNQLSGPIPESLGHLSKLNHLRLSYNPFEGIVCDIHFANLTRLESLEMHSTSLILSVSSNWIPPFQLKYLYLRSVKVATQFPAWLRTQKELNELDLSDTGISDTIPTWFWNLSSQFAYLNLSHNQIKGELPEFLESHVSYFFGLYMQSNHFKGPLPRLISPYITELDLSNNSISGPISDFLCNSLNGTNRLRLLDISENLLSGELPDCWMYWPSLVMINLGTNKLTGNIPNSFGSLFVLESLHLHNNDLLGELPPSFENCRNLIAVDLSENGLSGDIPTWMGKSIPDLLVISLRSNNFTGGIPPELCHLTFLQMLDLAHNHLSGTIPRCFSNLSALATNQIKLQRIFQYSMFWGSYALKALLVTKGMQLEYSNTLTLFTSVDLSSNNFFGEIPEELTSLLGLRSLNLSHNCFTGKIPEKIGALNLLESLDFSVNKLSGVIPQSISSLTFLGTLNLSHNNLSGKIPTSTQLQSFSEFSYIGNQGLCGPPLKENCKIGEAFQGTNDGDKVQEDKDGHGIDMESFYMGMTLGIIVGFWVVFCILLLNKSWRFAYFRFIDDVNHKFCTLFK